MAESNTAFAQYRMVTAAEGDRSVIKLSYGRVTRNERFMVIRAGGTREAACRELRSNRR